MTPQTVTEPILPVTLGPPKFATVVSQSSPMTPMRVAIGVEDSQGKKRRQVADRRDGDRHVADGEREEVQEEHDEVARLPVGVLGVGRHAALRWLKRPACANP